MKGNDEPWLGECSYGDEPMQGQGDILSYDEIEWELRQRNERLMRASDGYYNDRGRVTKVRNAPRVVGRNWAMLERHHP